MRAELAKRVLWAYNGTPDGGRVTVDVEWSEILRAQQTMTDETRESGSKEVTLSWIDRIKYGFVRFFLLALLKGLGLRGMYAFGWFFGWCESWLQYNRRRGFYRKMDRIFQPKLTMREKRRHVRDFCCRVRCDKMIYEVMDQIPKETILGNIESQGLEHIDAALKRGKGCFLMFSHQGSHHLGGILMTLQGYPLVGLRDPNESPLRIYMQQLFEKSFPEFRGLTIISTDAPVRPYFRAFRDNKLVAAAMDISRHRGDTTRTVDVQVFGETRPFMAGMTTIALHSRAVVLVGFIVSLPWFRYRIVVHPWLIDPEMASDDEATVGKVMQDYAHLIEQHTRQYPSQISRVMR